MDIIVLLLKKDLANRECLPLMALSALLLGTLSAGIAAIFGDIALDKAISLGFASGPLETHEMFALITLGAFIVYCLLRLLAVWRRYALWGLIGWIAILPGLTGVGFLITTAYYGGELVYHSGVNVATVLPQQDIVQKLTLINPMRYFMVIARGVFLEGTPFHLPIDQSWPLALIGIVTLRIASWPFRRRLSGASI